MAASSSMMDSLVTLNRSSIEAAMVLRTLGSAKILDAVTWALRGL